MKSNFILNKTLFIKYIVSFDTQFQVFFGIKTWDTTCNVLIFFQTISHPRNLFN